ncbi:MAG: polymerase IV protein [Parcubacteria group bacterium GW2011_GWE2_39_37]|uniref:Polymerase IV protein n=1 Tax=Candidatus Falkowbacteria bacterium GW2011_GWF2_39_8 TaxID=1618642 RepID=A0A0G0PZ60_9BACT|nr:MAG: polymerase IV protein [Parcubacteria group bacterium GW2011_GWE2_39_37]KKR33213.1 MAG: polymerase IV protein [Candidatus Falkowbacteria bacterium GW2011_GWF2_39_8]
MTQRVIMHLDMNSYFASVEQQANPFLRGKPVGVCAYLSPNGTIIASSIEAKAKGIKTGTKVGEALLLEPKVVLVENEPAKYRCVTEKIFKILSEYTDRMEPYSIDEAFMDLTGFVKNFTEAEKIAEIIKQRIKAEVGEWLKCSVGISWTKFLAKFAGDIAPKNGVLVIDKSNLDNFLKRDLTEAWGVGKAMSLRLGRLGIRNLLELKKYNPTILQRHLGIYGYQLWAHVNGEEISEINLETPLPKSIGHSYCIPQKTTDKVYLLKILYKLCEKTGRRLRAQELEAQNVWFSCAYVCGGGLSKTFRSLDKIFTTAEIFAPLENYLSVTEITNPVSKLAVSVGNLLPLSGQQSLFCERIKNKNLSLAMDKLNDRFGEYTVTNGLMFKSEDIARDRVGFRKTLTVKF